MTVTGDVARARQVLSTIVSGSALIALGDPGALISGSSELPDPDDLATQIAGDLAAGERIIVDGLQKVRPGVPVPAQEAAAESEAGASAAVPHMTQVYQENYPEDRRGLAAVGEAQLDTAAADTARVGHDAGARVQLVRQRAGRARAGLSRPASAARRCRPPPWC